MMMFVGAFMEYIMEKCKHTATDHLENLNCRGRDLILAGQMWSPNLLLFAHTRDTVVIVALKSPSCSEFVVRNSFAKTHFLCTLVRHDQSVSPISPESRSLTSFSSRTILIRQKSGDKTDVRNKIRG